MAKTWYVVIESHWKKKGKNFFTQNVIQIDKKNQELWQHGKKGQTGCIVTRKNWFHKLRL